MTCHDCIRERLEVEAKMKKCEVCGHPENVHYRYENEREGQVLFCKECGSRCF
jgi:transcription elongation factor Elf1